ncbi:uncharacterized protein [Dermacentor albipictus]|uniref:uncharacterized protein isoform X1 n=1 Tax=Dermacentor albipictus TaxID=60249 RepID=UPI0038FC2FBA
MAFSLLPFDRLSVKQLHIVAAQRRRNGFHAYYTGGFDATRKQFGFITPGYLLRGCSITTVFLYPSPGATAGGSKTMYATNLGQYSKHLRYLVSLTFKGDTDAYVEYWYANVKQSGYDLSSRDLKGFHVVQYEVNENGLQVIVDGESVIPPGTITGVDEYTVYYTNSTLELAPFAFFESHYTMDDVAAIINVPAYYNSSKEFYFDHDNVDISAGGYALWNGTWSPGQDVIVSGEGLAGKLYVPETGKLVALVKVYRSSATFFSDADNPSKPPTVLASNNSFGLSSLRIQPSPHNLVEFKAVTGEITY